MAIAWNHGKTVEINGICEFCEKPFSRRVHKRYKTLKTCGGYRCGAKLQAKRNAERYERLKRQAQ